MLSCEGNAGERWKTTIDLIGKKATLHVQQTFLYIFLPLFCTTTTWNFHKLLSYTLYGGYVVRVLAHFFFHCRSFSPCIGGRYHFLFSHCSYKIVMLFLYQKKCLLCCLSLALDLCRPFSRWASLACRLLSLFLCLSLALFSIFLGLTILLV